MSDKFCIHCKHSAATSDSSIYLCTQDEKKVDLVTGEQSFGYCSIMRMSTSPCGREGRLFEPNAPINIEELFPNFPSIRG
jgi:hypothetical protein